MANKCNYCCPVKLLDFKAGNNEAHSPSQTKKQDDSFGHHHRKPSTEIRKRLKDVLLRLTHSFLPRKTMSYPIQLNA